MGVPKFFRWISERYPCLGEIIKDYQVPEFDNLYLDMNGIFHVCSHPDDDNAHFRITEENIFKNIFHYIEVLFRKIKPQKVFFMAVDGVAPRAKLNQQRGRRFRTAKLAEDAVKKAENTGEKLPEQAPFDSNCITPGTEFMTKLDEQLKYFISKKISTDSLWQNCTVIYSGHKTPGEGEHKIMDYIRFCRSQSDYDPNTRHCLYGLDADLIMLGLTSHEPHFSLLREEIIYGKKTRRIQTPEEINFYLFHLSLMREYLHLEFASLHSIHFGYDVESVIDDVVLLGFLVGNDFIPNLPELHINKEGLSLLFSTYKRCLPKLDGYLNEKGTLNLKRFEVFMQHLSEMEIDKFRDTNDDMKYLASKSRRREADERAAGLEMFNFDDDNAGELFECPELESISNQEVRNTLEKLGLEEQEEFSDLEDDSLPEDEQIFRSEFRQYKHNYYKSKFEFSVVNSHVLKDLAVHYVRGLQWILNYYFNGICSWSWFYPFHYSPYISDVANFSDVELIFDMATAFLPYQQLLAVLPPYSVSLVPKAYHHLMMRENSLLEDFYPKEFRTDLNGKVQEWEAVVLIPFIDEDRLIAAMEPCNDNLLEEEAERNQHGPQFIYNFTADNLGIYRAPDYFCTVTANHATVREEPKNAWYLVQSDVFKGLHPKVDLNVHYDGFPTLRHLAHNFRITREDVKVFQQSSRNESVILQVLPMEPFQLSEVAEEYLNKHIYVSWPHLQEAKVKALSNGEKKYQLIDGSLNVIDMTQPEIQFWHTERKDLSDTLLRRWGIDGGTTEVLVHCQTLCGMRYSCTREGEISLEKQWSSLLTTYPWQLAITNIKAYNPHYKMFNNIGELFPNGTKVFMLGNPYYGSMGTVNLIDGGRVRVEMIIPEEPNLGEAKANFYNNQQSYLSAGDASSRICMSTSLFARITGTILVNPAARTQPFQKDQKFINKTNIGMNLKNNVRGEEVRGYTRKEHSIWYYSELCVSAVESYYEKFPQVFQFLSSNDNHKATIYQDEIFDHEWKENFNKLKTYLDEVPFAKAERKKCLSTVLDESSLILVDKEIKKYSSIAAKRANMQIRPHLLFLPNQLQGSSAPDNTTTFEILDRVINVREGYSVPLGALGTVIGIHPSKKEMDTTYDIMFDESFIGGLGLLGPISGGRCCRMYWSAIINLSHGIRKTGKQMPSNKSKIYNRQEISTNPSRNNYANRRPQNYPAPAINPNNGPSGFQLTTYNNNFPTQSTSHPPPASVPVSSSMNTINAPAPSALPPPNFNFALKTFASALPQTEVPAANRKAEHPTNGRPAADELPKMRRNNESLREEQKTDKPMKLSNQKVDVRNLPFLIHGTTFSKWYSIKHSGLSNGMQFIPCVKYIPTYFQLLVYLDIKKLVKDGYYFIDNVKDEFLCSTDSNLNIPFSHIDKVYDTQNDQLIYVSPTCKDQHLHLPDINRTARMKGRAQAMKELREVEEQNDPIAVGRRIRESLRPMNTFSKQRLVMPGTRQIDDMDWSATNTASAFPAKTPFPPQCPLPPAQVMDAVPEPLSSVISGINLGEDNFPSLPRSDNFPSLPRSDNFPSFPRSDNFPSLPKPDNFPSLSKPEKKIFIPTQVIRSKTSGSTSSTPQTAAENVVQPQRVISSPMEPEIATAFTKKEVPSAVGKTKVSKAKVERCRLAANFSAMPDSSS